MPARRLPPTEPKTCHRPSCEIVFHKTDHESRASWAKRLYCSPECGYLGKSRSPDATPRSFDGYVHTLPWQERVQAMRRPAR